MWEKPEPTGGAGAAWQEGGPTPQACLVLRLSHTTHQDTVSASVLASAQGAFCLLSVCHPLLFLCSCFSCHGCDYSGVSGGSRVEPERSHFSPMMSGSQLPLWKIGTDFYPTQSIPMPSEAWFLKVPSDFYDWFCDAYISPRTFLP